MLVDLDGSVDPDRGWRSRRDGQPLDEALRGGGEGAREDAVTSGQDPVTTTMMHVGGGEQRQAGMVVLVIVPVEQRSAVYACVLPRAETFGETWPVLHGLEQPWENGLSSGRRQRWNASPSRTASESKAWHSRSEAKGSRRHSLARGPCHAGRWVVAQERGHLEQAERTPVCDQGPTELSLRVRVHALELCRLPVRPGCHPRALQAVDNRTNCPGTTSPFEVRASMAQPWAAARAHSTDHQGTPRASPWGQGPWGRLDHQPRVLAFRASCDVPARAGQASDHGRLQGGSRVGDLVLDPFCGTGTTLTAAERLGRRWLGVELKK